MQNKGTRIIEEQKKMIENYEVYTEKDNYDDVKGWFSDTITMAWIVAGYGQKPHSNYYRSGKMVEGTRDRIFELILRV